MFDFLKYIDGKTFVVVAEDDANESKWWPMIMDRGREVVWLGTVCTSVQDAVEQARKEKRRRIH